MAQRQRYPVPYPHPRQLLGGRPKNQQKYIRASTFANLKHGEERVLYRIYRICGNSAICPVPLSRTRPESPNRRSSFPAARSEALPAYKERWTIETMFKVLKSSGFNIEDTHMVHINRIDNSSGLLLLPIPGPTVLALPPTSKSKAVRVLKQREACNQSCQVRSPELHR